MKGGLENLVAGAKYDGKSFDDVLKFYFGETKMSELLVHVRIPAVNM